MYRQFLFYELSDEGFYHSLLIAGPKIVLTTPFYLLGHPIGCLWQHQLLGYRFFNLFMVLIMTLAIWIESWECQFPKVKKNQSAFWLYGLLLICLSFGVFFKTPTLSYH